MKKQVFKTLDKFNEDNSGILEALIFLAVIFLTAYHLAK